MNKIVRAVERCADELDEVDPPRVATKTISGLYDGATHPEATVALTAPEAAVACSLENPETCEACQ